MTTIETTPPGTRAPRGALIPALIMAAVAVIITLCAALAPAHAGPVRLHHWHRTPVGFTIAGLQHNVLTAGSISEIEGELATAKHAYHANTIRLQVTQDRLVGHDGRHLDYGYLYDVEAVTNYGRSLGLTMVLNAQTEWSPGFGQGSGHADRATMAFWRVLTGVYANARHVEFDLFNEPRHLDWPLWEATTQPIVTMIRHHGARNWIWLEGPKYASTLEGVPMLHGGRLIYTFHHPGAPWAGMAEHTAETWDRAFGYLAQAGHPVIDGEYTNDAKTYHMAPADVRAYLSYAKANHIGMIVFGLRAHHLITAYRRA
jgi:Cellulase (glycosyl hydrolase family 5)